MTLLARHAGVRSGQRELCDVVIKVRRSPSVCGVANSASRREGARLMIRGLRIIVIDHVA